MKTTQTTKPEPHDENCQCRYCIPIIDDPTLADRELSRQQCTIQWDGRAADEPAQAQHSPLPWTVTGTDKLNVVSIKGGFYRKGQQIATAAHYCGGHPDFPDSREQAKANAAYIVHACNNAQRLADKLAEVLTFVGHKPSCRGGGYGVQPCDCGAQAVIPKAREALAEWSKQK